MGARRLWILAVVLWMGQGAFAQQSKNPEIAQRSDRADPTNDDVVTMAKAGLSEALIITFIRQAKTRAFDRSPQSLIQRKAAGVNENILTVMLNPGADVPFSAPEPATASNKVDEIENPTAPREPGTYVDVAKNEAKLTATEDLIAQVRCH